MGASRYGEILTSLDIQKYEIFGSDYIINVIKQTIRDDAYRYYITDALSMIAENTAKPYGGNYLKQSYRDMITPKIEEDEEEIVDCEAVVNNIWSKMTRRDDMHGN